MTAKEWKRLRSGAVIRRKAGTQDELFAEDKEYLFNKDEGGNVWVSDLWGNLIPRGRFSYLTEPAPWEVVFTASQYAKRQRQWLKEQERDNRDDEEHEAAEDDP